MSDVSHALLPKGFQAQVDLGSYVSADRRHLLGGSPRTLVTLSERAASMIDRDGRLKVVDEASAALARRLMARGVAHPRPMFGPSAKSVTVVIPVRDNNTGLQRLLPALTGMTVIVVDDGSATPVVSPDVTVVRTDKPHGPAAARNLGARLAETDLVAFLDSDVVPHKDWLDVLLPHFSDPNVAMVAPRIVAMQGWGNAVVRYEAMRSSLDQGAVEATVRPGTRVAYVPSAAVIVRRKALTAVDGFDVTLPVAEDVDLCWRLCARGWVIRYDPVATVAHCHRQRLGECLDRKRYYGTGAALLATRHPEQIAPVSLSMSLAVGLLALSTRTWSGAAVAAVMSVVASVRVRRVVGAVPEARGASVRVAGETLTAALRQGAAALCRHYWPLAVVVAMVSRNFRQVLVAVAITEAVVDWSADRQGHAVNRVALDPVRYVLMRRLDDLAYGYGLWEGAVRQRSPRALRPSIRLSGVRRWRRSG